MSMPTSTRREKLFVLNKILDNCHKVGLNHRSSALADSIFYMVKPFGFGTITEKQYVRLIVDALIWEGNNPGKEFRFAD